MSTVAIFVYVGLALLVRLRSSSPPPRRSPPIKWGLGAAVSDRRDRRCSSSIMFGEMQADRIIRELKRVELMLAAREK